MRRVLPSAALLTLLLASGAWGCTSRTLPLPPPTIDEVSAPDINGMVTVTGVGADEDAVIAVLKIPLDGTQPQQGVMVESAETDCGNSCRFEAQLPAEPGDNIWVWQFLEAEGASRDNFVPETP